MALEPGRILKNRYRILEAMTQGGFGAVYRAEDTRLKTVCALKENLDYWEESRRQFEQEALLLAGLQHSNLPRVTDYFLIPHQGQYLVMDFVEGYDLQEIIDRVARPMIEKKVLGWMNQICDAVIYLHNQRPPVIHRDIKPANIRLTPGGKVMLVDFGVAKRYNPEVKTTEGARAVTPGYSPLEQYGEGKTDIRADIYSLGATLYTLLTAARPPESIELINGPPLPPPRSINPSISPAVERVILRAMELNPAGRYASVDLLRHALRDAAAVPVKATQAANQSRRTTPGKAAASQPGLPRRDPVLRLKEAVQMEWVQVPAGMFLFGENLRRRKLSEFEIARYPVTNLQYGYFLQANPGYPAPPGWRGRELPIGKGRHPVVGISYGDAQAFCEWLGCRLPTVEEWEKAARGTDGRRYPWGEAWEDGRYCNHWEAGNQGTTPVDRYPESGSPYGVMDMAGNVWEWTATAHGSRWMHELCGGSFRSFSRLAVQTTVRDRMLLDDYRDDVGFRCARDPEMR